MAARRDMDPLDITPKLLPWIMILDVEEAPRRFRYRLVGTRVVELLDRDLTGRYLDDQRNLGPVIDEILRRYNIVADTGEPLNFEGDLIDVNGDKIWAERLALPLGATDDLTEGIMVGFATPQPPGGGDAVGPDAA